MNDHPDYRDELEPAPEILLPNLAKSLREWGMVFERHGILTGDGSVSLEIIQVHEAWDNGSPQRRSGLYLVHLPRGVRFEQTLDSVYVFDEGDWS